MPLEQCTTDNGRPGWRWGESGKCYPYTKGNTKSEMYAKQQALMQARAIINSQKKAGKPVT
jgi:hypothetical protein